MGALGLEEEAKMSSLPVKPSGFEPELSLTQQTAV